MNKRQRKSNRKRQYKSVESVSSKRQRTKQPQPPPLPLPPPAAAANETAPPTKITDLDDDCLEKIFMLLDLENLLNVTLSNKWLGPAANVVYRSKFGECKVCVHSVHFVRRNDSCADAPSPLIIRCEENTIVIRNFKTCLQYLRCFGTSIQHLEIDYGHSESKRYDYVHKYVNEYCVESLSNIGLYFMPPFAIKNFQKPFVKVRTVQMYGCDLSEQFLSFAQWFPNVCHFNIHGFGLKKYRFIAVPPTQLEHLSITLTDLECGNILELYKCIGDLVKSNRKLHTLIIRTSEQMEINSLLNMIKHNRTALKMVATADLKSGGVYGVETMWLKQFHMLQYDSTTHCVE